ncbi:DNA repair protein RadA [Synechococcus sp. CBW1004]|uniref:DNA repair protein RadA n=1 Tax=Synechococcus sp. CBW1004 TaxID=1353136 RepID=UPI0018CDAF23|nr:DNA repair protein RadA [Synechococcus sp. CBW1004]QPN62137.1 DNA repair protein RadA [Synechococcus sp. CBW1004]
MPKASASYVCQACGARTRQFFGRCSACGAWNTLVEQREAPVDARRRRPVAEETGATTGRPRRSEPIETVGERPLQRLASGYGELDRVLGGGLVPGSLVLVGGDPGIGKSTLLLQCARAMALSRSVLYVSAEESAQQVKLRWRRLHSGDAGDGVPAGRSARGGAAAPQVRPSAGAAAPRVSAFGAAEPAAPRRSAGAIPAGASGGPLPRDAAGGSQGPPPGGVGSATPAAGSAVQRGLAGSGSDESPTGDPEAAPGAAPSPSPSASLQLLAETDLELVLQELEALRPAVAIIDSIQALHDAELASAPGSVAQVRECAAALARIAKRQDTALVLVGHVTKEGALAGPKVLEHLVDAVLTFEGDRFASHRLLRAVKNRFGATHELGVFEMRDRGLHEVANPSELFLGGGEPSSGTATIVACEGTRPLLVELQALVSTTSYASPRRTATGIAVNRLHQILAVLEKHLGLPLSRFDCYLAVAGGLEVEEPAADLGVAAAVVASYRDLTLPPGTALIGELGLGGQLRPVGQLELRLQEAARLGFTRAVVPRGGGLGPIAAGLGLELREAGTVAEALVAALGVNPAEDA